MRCTSCLLYTSTPLPKDGNIINSGLKKGDKILVKVTREAFGTKGPSPVSYTHLDVYKRQA